jgi:tungstate transport system permease protein
VNEILDGIVKALQLIFSGDPQVYGIVYRSIFFSGTAMILATFWGIPLAMLIGLKDFRGRFIIKGFFTTMMGMPTVALGLILYLTFSHGGPLGFLDIIYTPAAIILGQAVLVTPIIVSIATEAIEAVDPDIMNLAKTLGASESQASFAVLKEALNGVLLSNTASFNRAIAELGVALLVGGNIAGTTDVLTTSISRYTNTHDLDLAIALTIILLAIVFGINLAIILIRKSKIVYFLSQRILG